LKSLIGSSGAIFGYQNKLSNQELILSLSARLDTSLATEKLYLSPAVGYNIQLQPRWRNGNKIIMSEKKAYIIAGPNGSGKTTFASEFIKEMCLLFVNADEIALELSPKNLAKARVKAGKLFLEHINQLITKNTSFIVETTLAGKYFIGILNRLKKATYKTEIIYIFVESAEEAVRRIRVRVQKGGHAVPVKDILRRLPRSMNNFWNIYRHKAESWQLFLNSKDEFLQVAVGTGKEIEIIDEAGFALFRRML